MDKHDGSRCLSSGKKLLQYLHPDSEANCLPVYWLKPLNSRRVPTQLLSNPLHQSLFPLCCKVNTSKIPIEINSNTEIKTLPYFAQEFIK